MNSKQPKAPNPYQTAAAQTTSNVETGLANAALGNANENGPLGSVKYSTSPGSVNVGGYNIPQYTRTITLTPAQKTLQRQQEAIGKRMNTVADAQLKRVGSALSKPISTAGLVAAPGDFEGYRGKIEAGLNSRLDPALQRSRAALEAKLLSQGFSVGSQGFNDAMDESRRQENDARIQTFLNSGNEARAAGSYQASQRQAGLQERAFLHNQPINEVTALMNGGQVSMPQFQPYNAATVNATDLTGPVYQSAALKQQAANANTAAISDVLGKGVSAGIYKWSDRRLKRDITPLGDGLYRYRYLWSDEWHIGVMADEVPHAAILMPNGFYMVDYARL